MREHNSEIRRLLGERVLYVDKESCLVAKDGLPSNPNIHGTFVRIRSLLKSLVWLIWQAFHGYLIVSCLTY